jgi:hypothetical protein
MIYDDDRHAPMTERIRYTGRAVPPPPRRRGSVLPLLPLLLLLLLVVVAAVMLTGCSGARPTTQQQGGSAAPAAGMTDHPYTGPPVRRVWDIAAGSDGLAIAVGYLPFPRAADGSDVCELPADMPLRTAAELREGRIPAAAVLHLARRGSNLVASYGTDRTEYVARPDYNEPPMDRLLRGSPWTFRPCPPWA